MSPKPVSRPDRTTAPAAADAVAYTLRLDPDDALAVDTWILELRQELGRTRLDKSEVLRALLDLARQRPEVRRALLRALS